jgi:hypothetical protein
MLQASSGLMTVVGVSALANILVELAFGVVEEEAEDE